VHTRVTRVPFLAATIGVIALFAAGCSASGNSASGPKAEPKAAVSPQQALLLAAHNSESVNTIAADISVQATTSSGAVSIAGTIAEQLHPSVTADANFSTFNVGGQSVAGGLAEVITTDGVYMKFAELAQALNTTKPWVEIPLKSLGATGSALSSLLSDASSENPVTQTELLAHSKTVHKVGTSVLDGVPVTEYAGTYSMSQAIAALPANVRSTLAKEFNQSGITDAQFKIWLDAQQQPRKIIVTDSGSAGTSTVTETVTSFNQPVSIQIPTSGETYVVPASALNGLSG